MTDRLFKVRLVNLSISTRFSPAAPKFITAMVKLYAISRALFNIRWCHLAWSVFLSAQHSHPGHTSRHWVWAKHSTSLKQGSSLSLLDSRRFGPARWRGRRWRCQGSCFTWLVNIWMCSDQWPLLVKTNRLLCRERNIDLWTHPVWRLLLSSASNS
jgi:hypothetical protein